MVNTTHVNWTDAGAWFILFFLQDHKRQTCLFSCRLSHCSEKCTLETKMWPKTFFKKFPDGIHPTEAHASLLKSVPFSARHRYVVLILSQSLCLVDVTAVFQRCFSQSLWLYVVSSTQQNKHHHSHFLDWGNSTEQLARGGDIRSHCVPRS